MPLLVSILQGWSHICEIGKRGFCETLLTQCNSCARRLVLSAKLFSLSPLSFYSSRFLSHRAFHFIAFFLLRVVKTFPIQFCSGLALCT